MSYGIDADAGKAVPRRSTLRLTTRIVDRLQMDDKDAIFWDRDLAGFGVRVALYPYVSKLTHWFP